MEISTNLRACQAAWPRSSCCVETPNSEPERQAEPESPAWLWRHLKRGWPRRHPMLRARDADDESDEAPNHRADYLTTSWPIVVAVEDTQAVAQFDESKSERHTHYPADEHALDDVGCTTSTHLHEPHAVGGQHHDGLLALTPRGFILRSFIPHLDPDRTGVPRHQRARVTAGPRPNADPGSGFDRGELQTGILSRQAGRSRQAGDYSGNGEQKSTN